MAEIQTSVGQNDRTTTGRPQGMVKRRSYPEWFEYCANQLQAAHYLDDNWNSYGGLKTNSLSALHAGNFLEQLAGTVSVLQPLIAVNACGNVCFEWDTGSWLMTVEITPQGEAKYYYERDEEEVENKDREYKTIIQYLTRP